MSNLIEVLDRIGGVTDEDYEPLPLVDSPYCDDQELLAILDRNINNYSMLSFNCCSLNARYNEIVVYLDFFKRHGHIIGIVCIQECWVAEKEDFDVYDIDGYKKHCYGSTASLRGGLVTYIHESLHFEKIPSPHRRDLWETIFSEVTDSFNNKLMVTNVYHPPRDAKLTKEFVTDFEDTLHFLGNKKIPVSMPGDFNIDLLKINANLPIPGTFFDLLLSNSLLPKITRPTRITSDSATLIDNIFTTFSPSTNLESAIPSHKFSDHQPCFSILPLVRSRDKKEPVYINIRKETLQAKNNFMTELSSIDFPSILDTRPDANPEANYEKFIKIILDLYDKHFPLKRSKFRKYHHKKNPWITDGLVKSIRKRDKLYSKLKKMDSNNPRYDILKMHLKIFNKVLRRSLKLARKSYYDNCFKTYQGDVKKTWQIINNLLSRGKSSSHPSKLVVDNEIIEDNSNMAEQFNSFFATIGPDLADKIPQSQRHFTDYLAKNNPPPFSFAPIDQNAVVKIIEGLKSKPTCSHDGISNKILKFVKDVISIPLSILINQSFLTSIFPDILKLARVIPLFKQGDTSSITNYRPISILSSISKVFERAIHDQLSAHLAQHNLLLPSQYGFRKTYSTELAGLHLVDSIASRLDDRYKTVGIFMDLSKAFDTLDHEIILRKLPYFGLNPAACSLIENYLSNRWQYVDLNGSCSSRKRLLTGVPQGSILGPLLFIMYINDIASATKSLNPVLFADDTTLLFSPGRNFHPVNLQNLLNEELSFVAEWFRANRLSLNLKKTKFMIFRKPNSIDLDINLSINGIQIERVKTFKFLGLMLNEKLTWSDHFVMIKTKVNKSIGILHRLKYILPFSILLTLYHSLVMSHLHFHLLIWGHDIDDWFILQKKALRAITKSHFSAHAAPIFKGLNLATLPIIFSVAKLKFYYKYCHNVLPAYFGAWKFQKLNHTHRYPTTQGSNIAIPIHHSDYIEMTLKFSLINFINTIPAEIAEKFDSHSIQSIVKIFRNTLISEIVTVCSSRNCFPCLHTNYQITR